MFRKSVRTRALLSFVGHCLLENLRRCAGNCRTLHRPGYSKVINARQGMEHVLGGINHAGGLKQLKAKGQFRVGAVFLQYMLAFNLIGLASLLSQSPKEVLA